MRLDCTSHDSRHSTGRAIWNSGGVSEAEGACTYLRAGGGCISIVPEASMTNAPISAGAVGPPEQTPCSAREEVAPSLNFVLTPTSAWPPTFIPANSFHETQRFDTTIFDQRNLPWCMPAAPTSDALSADRPPLRCAPLARIGSSPFSSWPAADCTAAECRLRISQLPIPRPTFAHVAGGSQR